MGGNQDIVPGVCKYTIEEERNFYRDLYNIERIKNKQLVQKNHNTNDKISEYISSLDNEEVMSKAVTDIGNIAMELLDDK